ncbi:MAG: hypothetical protein ACRDJM_08215 [Actinomycetota bacterium]
MRSVPIDDYIEAFEEARAPEAPPLGRRSAGDWGRLVEEGRSARFAADGGRWRIGQLAGQVEKRYGAGSLLRFAEEIGESYSTVRRYRWVASRYESATRFRFPSLSFSHYQAVAKLADRERWLAKAERGGWSVDALTRASSGDGTPDRDLPPDRRLEASIEAMRRHLSALASLDQSSLTRSGRRRIGQALGEMAIEIRRLQRRLGVDANRTSPRRGLTRRARVAVRR